MFHEESNSTGIRHKTEQVLAMAYVLRQQWREIYKHDCGLMHGTIFAELDKPWHGKRGGGYR